MYTSLSIYIYIYIYILFISLSVLSLPSQLTVSHSPSVPWNRIDAIVYICACTALPLHPARHTSSKISQACFSVPPDPPYSSGIITPTNPPSIIAFTNSSGYPFRLHWKGGKVAAAASDEGGEASLVKRGW